ncbi:helix-turn-helix transcriptional regulator [Dyadobacter sp. CY356]|uniref:helix-turn-helix domain-containing protein n=1 Tax=Dyadobacter sp. CY356 TaxID=2906442 RepID=UPI001F489297|nr:helix-turn-helix transcriptional regulator [Dyadobacter sp. CY356]MCF0055102.1 helix-turn-helix transcriptional regulator [Dyadobacter sp. CY356]
MNPKVSEKLFNKPLIFDCDFEGSFDSLTKREWDVLLLVADDVPNENIADNLSLALKSVKTYKTRIAIKLSLLGRDQLARFARKNKDWLQEYYSHYFL